MNKPAPVIRDDFVRASRIICDSAENGILDTWNTYIGIPPKDVQEALCQPPFENCTIKIERPFLKIINITITRHNQQEDPDIHFLTSWNFYANHCNLDYAHIAPHLQGKGHPDLQHPATQACISMN